MIGPGYPTRDGDVESVLHALGRVGEQVVVDADALNHLARRREPWAGWAGAGKVLTPHPGEAARLLRCFTEDVQSDRFGAVERLVAASGAVCVLKGAYTLVGSPDGGAWVCPAGNQGMATAGSGDVLSGVIGALLARGLDPFMAAVAGVYWHGRAGDLAMHQRGENALRARDLIDALSDVEKLVC